MAQSTQAAGVRFYENGIVSLNLPIAGEAYVANEIWATIPRATSPTGARRLLATRLTQRNKREVKGSGLPVVALPRVDHHCRDCGVTVPSDKERCSKCWKRITRVNFDLGRKAAQRQELLAKRAATMRAHRQEISSWKPSNLPAWLTRDVYVKRVQPALARVMKSEIRSALGVSEPYASVIQAGKRVPHARHWWALANLAGVYG